MHTYRRRLQEAAQVKAEQLGHVLQNLAKQTVRCSQKIAASYSPEYTEEQPRSGWIGRQYVAYSQKKGSSPEWSAVSRRDTDKTAQNANKKTWQTVQEALTEGRFISKKERSCSPRMPSERLLMDSRASSALLKGMKAFNLITLLNLHRTPDWVHAHTGWRASKGGAEGDRARSTLGKHSRRLYCLIQATFSFKRARICSHDLLEASQT